MYYTITLTKSGGLSEEDVESLGKYFESCQHAYLVNEFGSSGGNSHIQGIVEFDTKVTSNVTGRIERQYAKLNIDVSKGISIKVKSATHLVGAFIYSSKELREGGKLVLLRGWNSTWIDQQVKENVKNIPYKMLKKRGTRVTQSTGPALMFEWCTANNMQITEKREYLEVVKAMGDVGYMFGCSRHLGLYQDVCALFDCGSAACSAAESALRFID